MIMHHSVNGEVFNTYDTKSINDRTAFLMGEVVTPEVNPFMDTSDHLAMLFPLRCAFCQLRVFPLYFGKSLLFLAEKARVGNFFTGGERGKSFESKVNAHSHILQYLGMNSVQRRAFLLQYRIRSLLPIAGERLTLLFIGFFAFLQQVVIEPTAFIQCLVEQGFLFLCWIDSILKHLTHGHIMCLSRTFVKQSHCGHSSRG